MKYLRFIVIFFATLFIGCVDTEGILEIKGKVFDNYTKMAIPRRKIFVQGLIQNDDKYIPVNAGQFITDSSGCFSFNLKKVKNAFLYNFHLVGDSSYAYSTNKLGMFELNRDAKFLFFYLSKLTDLSITIDRKSKTPLRDTLFVWWKSDGIDGQSLYPYKIENYGIASNKGLRWIGGDIKSVIKTKVYADKNTIVSWVLYRNGEENEFTDTIFCKRDAANLFHFKY